MWNAGRSQVRVRGQESGLRVMGLIRIPAAPVDQSVFSTPSISSLWGDPCSPEVGRLFKHNSLQTYLNKNSTFGRSSPMKYPMSSSAAKSLWLSLGNISSLPSNVAHFTFF